MRNNPRTGQWRQKRRLRLLATGVAATLAVSGAASALAAAPAQAAPTAGALPAKAASQIAALQQIKESLTPTQRKLDSRLAVAVRERANARTTDALPRLQSGVTVGKGGRTAVDVSVTKVSAALLGRLRDVGATVTYASERLATVRVSVPVSQLDTVASWPDVQHVAVAVGARTAHETDPSRTGSTGTRSDTPVTATTKAADAKRLDAQLRRALATPAADQGAVVSEGDKAEGVDRARARTGVTGTGTKVCALSDGVDSLAASQAAGELPAVDVLPDQAGSGDEGTAMLEIIHDLAPNAALGFATAFTSEASFADNIRALRSRAKCDIIVDDIEYFDESPFQDGPVARSVDVVTADGALYFSSAGNEGNTIDGTSGNFEGDFADSGRSVGKFTGTANDFDPGAGVQTFEPISDASSAGVPVTLFWADPLHGAGDDYDLYLFDADNNVVSFSQDVQDGNDDPYERLDTPLFGGTGLRLAVVKFAGANRYFQLSALGSRFSNSADGLKAFVTPGVTRGHNSAARAFSVAAAPAADPLPFALEPGDPPNPSGPFPGQYTTSQQPERFTSDGPRRIFFTAAGTPITPGNFSATGGTVRQKPDVTAADGVSTSVPGFSPFFGTSAAAPHAAAIAALVLSGNPSATLGDVRAAFEATALDLPPRGVDGRTGYGVLNANAVLRYTGATPQPLVTAGTPTLTRRTGDQDNFLEPGESATAAVPVTNVGDGTATGVSLVLTSSDPKVTVTPRSQLYGTVAAGATRSRDFVITLAADYPLGKPVQLAASVTFAGRLSPQSTTLTISTGQPGAPKTFAYAGPAVAIPDGDPTGASVTIPVRGIGYAADLNFSIDGTVCSTTEGSTTVGIDHTYVGDLVATLTNPRGVSAQVFSHVGTSGNNLCRVVFDDDAATPFSSLTSSDAPFTGTYQPAQPLESLLSTPVNGDWSLTVVDATAVDSGSIRAVSLEVTGFVKN